MTSSRPRKSSFWDQDLGRFVGWSTLASTTKGNAGKKSIKFKGSSLMIDDYTQAVMKTLKNFFSCLLSGLSDSPFPRSSHLGAFSTLSRHHSLGYGNQAGQVNLYRFRWKRITCSLQLISNEISSEPPLDRMLML